MMLHFVEGAMFKRKVVEVFYVFNDNKLKQNLRCNSCI